ncbi:hypothetical protein AVEN_116710-1 [Araneus ventricosus]|uniref:Uncharacterized protein n=1 Tax=Araneus ventricosus TaxID=182803 RepID=A0A4Y2EKL6_ARAVE|nr:hypothetical protein AVEN_116710-1 [Araneus ventricosus]
MTDYCELRHHPEVELIDVQPRNGARVCLTGEPDLPNRGNGLPDRGHDLLYGEDECNEIGLKFSPNYYLSTRVEYPVQKFSHTGYKICSRRGGAGHPGPPSGANPGLTP